MKEVLPPEKKETKRGGEKERKTSSRKQHTQEDASFDFDIGTYRKKEELPFLFLVIGRENIQH